MPFEVVSPTALHQPPATSVLGRLVEDLAEALSLAQLLASVFPRGPSWAEVAEIRRPVEASIPDPLADSVINEDPSSPVEARVGLVGPAGSPELHGGETMPRTEARSGEARARALELAGDGWSQAEIAVEVAYRSRTAFRSRELRPAALEVLGKALTTHELRHTANTLMREAGIPDWVIQRRMVTRAGT